MPHQRLVNVLHYADGKLWFELSEISELTYEEKVLESARAILQSVDDIDAWGTPIPEHEPDECVECDAIRLLDELALELQDDASLEDVREALDLRASART